MIAKKHLSSGRLVLAVCDEEILGKKFEEGDKVLDLASAFYKGETISEEEFLSLIKKSYMISAAGLKTIDILAREKIISMKDVKEVSGVPCIHVLFA